MDDRVIDLHIPADLFFRLERVATASSESVEEVILRCLRAGMPPSLTKVPYEFHPDLLALNGQNDQHLWDVVMNKIPYAGPIDQQRLRADFLTLRRSYAFALLKWRGHPVPDPSDIFLE